MNKYTTIFNQGRNSNIIGGITNNFNLGLV